MAQSLKQIITKDGDEVVAAALGFGEAYMRHIRTGIRRASNNVMAKALEVYGRRRFSAEATLADNQRVTKHRVDRPRRERATVVSVDHTTSSAAA